jgi:hypothetical protein
MLKPANTDTQTVWRERRSDDRPALCSRPSPLTPIHRQAYRIVSEQSMWETLFILFQRSPRYTLSFLKWTRDSNRTGCVVSDEVVNESVSPSPHKIEWMYTIWESQFLTFVFRISSFEFWVLSFEFWFLSLSFEFGKSWKFLSPSKFWSNKFEFPTSQLLQVLTRLNLSFIAFALTSCVHMSIWCYPWCCVDWWCFQVCMTNSCCESLRWVGVSVQWVCVVSVCDGSEAPNEVDRIELVTLQQLAKVQRLCSINSILIPVREYSKLGQSGIEGWRSWPRNLSAFVNFCWLLSAFAGFCQLFPQQFCHEWVDSRFNSLSSTRWSNCTVYKDMIDRTNYCI